MGMNRSHKLDRRPHRHPGSLIWITAALLCAEFSGVSAATFTDRGLLFTGLETGEERFGLSAPADPRPLPLAADHEEAVVSGSGRSPFVAGLLSAVVPGTGQLVQGQNRGWIYLGVEVVAWFSYFGLRSAGHQAEEDFGQFADSHWDWERYENVSDCGDGLGPVNFQEERDLLQDLFDNDLGDFYQTVGRRNTYACGWDTQENRAEFLSIRDDANDLFRASRYLSTAAFLNHLVSAVDAVRSAAGHRKRAQHSLGWRVTPTPSGALAFRVALNRRF